VLGLAILVLSAFLGGVTYASFTTATFEDEAQVAVERTLSETPASLSLLSMDVQYEGFPFRQPTHVVVTVGHPPGTLPPPIADRVAARISAIDVQLLGIAPTTTDRVSVEVRFVAIDQAA
jgi:hypothetical protein